MNLPLNHDALITLNMQNVGCDELHEEKSWGLEEGGKRDLTQPGSERHLSRNLNNGQ